MPTLADRLRERIRREGPISFLDFMEAALYDGDAGYYSVNPRIGEPGDFVTSPHLTPAFAGAIARRFQQDAATLTGPVDFVDVGAGDGRFLEDLAERLAADAPEVASRLRLTAVERSEVGRAAVRRRRIAPTPRILERPEGLEERSVTGWIFSNELYDALPVARVVGGREGLEELRVGVDGDRFVWVRAAAPADFSAHLARFPVTLAEGQVAEVRPAAAPLHRALARALARGRLVSFDYGHRSAVLFHPAARPHGTLAVHSGGRRGGDPLEIPGGVDLTAHVNWDDLTRAGEEEGLVTEGIFRQGRYLAESGLMDLVRGDHDKWRAFRLIDPDGMGEELSVLVQSRGV